MPFPYIVDARLNRFYFITIKGAVMPPGQLVRDITRPGFDGVAFRQEGKRTETVEMNSVETLEHYFQAQAQMIRYRDLQGAMVSLIDDFQNPYTGLVVVAVTRTDLVPLVKSVGGPVDAPKFMMKCKWMLRQS